MPKILFVDQSQVLGGAELSLIDIAGRIEGSAVAVFERGEFSDRLDTLGITNHVLADDSALSNVTRDGGIAGGLKAVPALFGTARKIARIATPFDIIYANTQKAMLAAGIAGWLSKRPVVWHLRDLMTPDHFSQSHIAVAIRTANLLVDKIIANSESTSKAFVAAGGNASKVVTVYNGIDPEPFQRVDDASAARVRSSLGLDDKFVAGIFSRLAGWKGQHVLIEAISRIDDCHALIVGGALFQEDHLYEEELHQLAARYNVSDRVHFLGFREDISTLMRIVDVVVHASTSAEPFGRVIVEGMFARTPVVASNGGGAAEIIKHEETGFLFEPGNADELADVLLKARAAATESKFTKDAYDDALIRFGVDRLVDDILKELAPLTS